MTKLAGAYDKALIEQDAAAFDRLLADEYTVTLPNGKVLTKAEVVANAKSGIVKYEADKTKSDSVKARVFGDTALVTGLWTEKGTSAGKDFDGTLQYTLVFLKRDGAWKIVSDHATLIEKDEE